MLGNRLFSSCFDRYHWLSRITQMKTNLIRSCLNKYNSCNKSCNGGSSHLNECFSWTVKVFVQKHRLLFFYREETLSNGSTIAEVSKQRTKIVERAKFVNLIQDMSVGLKGCGSSFHNKKSQSDPQSRRMQL